MRSSGAKGSRGERTGRQNEIHSIPDRGVVCALCVCFGAEDRLLHPWHGIVRPDRNRRQHLGRTPAHYRGPGAEPDHGSRVPDHGSTTTPPTNGRGQSASWCSRSWPPSSVHRSMAGRPWSSPARCWPSSRWTGPGGWRRGSSWISWCGTRISRGTRRRCSRNPMLRVGPYPDRTRDRSFLNCLGAWRTSRPLSQRIFHRSTRQRLGPHQVVLHHLELVDAGDGAPSHSRGSPSSPTLTRGYCPSPSRCSSKPYAHAASRCPECPRPPTSWSSASSPVSSWTLSLVSRFHQYMVRNRFSE